MLLDCVLRTISRYRMFEPGQKVAVAVSGGADSVCLLYALLELAHRWNLQLEVAHVDHGLRGEESRGDAEFVRGLAAELGLPYLPREIRVRDEPGNLEANAREARRSFFRELIAAGEADRVATGHTRSDQAETVLFRFLRGSGTAGLAGILPATPEGLVRPLIDVERSEARMWLGERGIRWREDSTNASPEFARNRIRHFLLPELTREWNPALTHTLARMAEWARDEEVYWRGEIDAVAAGLLRMKRGAVLFETGPLLQMPPAAARRLVRRALELAKGDLRAIGFDHVEAILGLAAPPGRVADGSRSRRWTCSGPSTGCA